MDTQLIKQVIGESINRPETRASDYVLRDNELEKVTQFAVTGNPDGITKPLSINAQLVADPLIREVRDLAEGSIYLLKEKLSSPEARSAAGLGESATVVEKMVKLHQLLTGGVTDNVGVMSQAISRRIINQSDLYD